MHPVSNRSFLVMSIVIFLALVSLAIASFADESIEDPIHSKPQARSLLFSTSSGIVLLQLFAGIDALEGNTNFFEQPRGGFLFGEQHDDPADTLIPTNELPKDARQIAMNSTRDILLSTSDGIFLMSYNDTVLYKLSDALNARSAMLSNNRSTLFYTSIQDGSLVLTIKNLQCDEIKTITLASSSMEDITFSRQLLLLSPLEDYAIVIDTESQGIAYLVDIVNQKSTLLSNALKMMDGVVTDATFIDSYTVALSVPEGEFAGTYSLAVDTNALQTIGPPSARLLRSASGKLVTLSPSSFEAGLFAQRLTIRRFSMNDGFWVEDRTFFEKEKALFRILQLLEMKSSFFHQVTSKNYQIVDILSQQ